MPEPARRPPGAVPSATGAVPSATGAVPSASGALGRRTVPAQYGPVCATRTWRPGRPVDLAATLGPLRRGAGDPTHRVTSDGAHWRVTTTPQGVGTLRLAVDHADGAVAAAAWGPGADWLLDRVPTLLGADDDPAGFVPGHPLLAEVARRRPGWRVPRTGLVMDSLVPTVLEQKVTGGEARAAWRDLVRRYGTPAPGPVPPGTLVAPSPEVWRRVPSWDWHRAGVDGARSRAIVTAATVAGRLEESAGMPHGVAEARLRAVRGIGVWTAAEVRQRAHGDPDAVSVGDLHVCVVVGWALVGAPLDDDGMLEVLQRWAGHRYRVQRLVELAGVRRPRFAPRFAPRDFRRS